LKYQNKRDEYINNFWDVVNWEFVEELYLSKIKK
jgi:Fe-Mn family superoxide dismutase